jgi:uroporphyrinogen decarboxylase
MNKREAMLSLLDPGQTPPYISAAFFLHFDPEYNAGQAAVDKHLEYFRATGMDLVKIQYERVFPPIPTLRTPDDWAQIPLYDRDFYAPQLRAVEGLVKAVGHEAIVVQTLYSPFMCAGQTTSSELVLAHIQAAPDKVRKGMEIITKSLMIFVKACIDLGVDGFYASTQGGETNRLGTGRLFDTCIRPYDLALMDEIDRRCVFNILHVCDYAGSYDDLTPFVDYPGHVVSAPMHVGGQPIAPREVARLFDRPYMGGLDRLGVIATGSPAEIRDTVKVVLRDAPERFILGADCTVPSETPWENLKLAIDMAHAFRRA